MTANGFKRTALSRPGAVEGSHPGAVDFRVGGGIRATLASAKEGIGNLMLSPEQQAALSDEQPEIFLPVVGGWGRSGVTHIRLAQANEEFCRARCLPPGSCGVMKNKPAPKKRES